MFTRHKHDDHTARDDHADVGRTRTSETVGHRTVDERQAHERFGGINLGADFFGWLVAIALTSLLTGIVGAIASAVNQTGAAPNWSQEAGTVGIAAAVILLVLAAIGYYAGGYVAGRMSRFDGGRQGLGVWLIGLVVMLLAAAAGWLFGREYNILERVNLPQLPFSWQEASIGGLIAVVVFLVVTLLAAMAGGKVGRNYHRKVDAAHVH